MAKYNQLLRIEEELGDMAQYNGLDVFLQYLQIVNKNFPLDFSGDFFIFIFLFGGFIY